MQQLAIVAHGDSAAVLLPADFLKSMGLRIGDTVEVTPGDHEFVLRPTPDAARRQLIEKITDEVFEERMDAYRRLA